MQAMKITTLLVLGLWVLIVGGNIVQAQILPPQTFMEGPRFPWLIVFMPIIVVVGAFRRRDRPGVATLGHWVDGRFGQGAYREFMRKLRLELLFGAMCFGIVLSALVRAFFFKTPVMPPEDLGFFASGGLAFLLAHLIRRRRAGA